MDEGHGHGEVFVPLPIVNGRVFDLIRQAIRAATDDDGRRGRYEDSLAILDGASTSWIGWWFRPAW